MSNFELFAAQVEKQFASMSKNEMYVTNISGDELYTQYLNLFPEGTNPIYRERTEHDCSCCKNFIRNIGNVVSIVNGKLVSVWDAKGFEHPYSVVAEGLSELVKQQAISNLFRTNERKYGNKHTFEQQGLKAVKWDHFHCTVHNKHYTKNVGSDLGKYSSNVQVFTRGLSEITKDALTTVLDLVKENAIYRGTEFLPLLNDFYAAWKTTHKVGKVDPHLFIWENAGKYFATIRNTVIGTLLVDLSEGVGLDKAVKSYEQKVAPANYKRPTALITKGMIEQAMKTMKALGIESSTERRYAKLSDLSVNNVLWVNNSVKHLMKDGIENILMSQVKEKPSKAKPVEIDMDKFVKTILPKTTSMSVLFQNSMQSNLMSLTAPVNGECPPIFKWDNQFAWCYKGNIADSDIRRSVQERGGRVDGVFRFSHSWNHEGQRNASLMDLHVFMPGSNPKDALNGVSDDYGNNERVGWNHRKHSRSGGVQDVDYTNPAKVGYVPVENITFPTLSLMRDGKYVCKIHNWNLRSPTTGGFRAEIEFAGNIFTYEVTRPLKHKEWVAVATVTLKGGVFSIEHHIEPGCASKEVWNVTTEKFVEVDTLTFSPNHWDNNNVGNKHWFFILNGCKSDEPARGIYNEFLSSELDKHRKVFEVLGDKTKCELVDEQLSGLGFSSTRKDSVIVRATTDSGTRQYKINF